MPLLLNKRQTNYNYNKYFKNYIQDYLRPLLRDEPLELEDLVELEDELLVFVDRVLEPEEELLFALEGLVVELLLALVELLPLLVCVLLVGLVVLGLVVLVEGFLRVVWFVLTLGLVVSFLTELLLVGVVVLVRTLSPFLVSTFRCTRVALRRVSCRLVLLVLVSEFLLALSYIFPLPRITERRESLSLTLATLLLKLFLP